MFKPIAEEVMTAAKSVQGIEGVKLLVLRERMQGKTKREIADEHRLNLSIVETYEKSILKTIAKTQPTLVKKLKEVRAMPFTEQGMGERKRVYESRYAEKHSDRAALSKRRYCVRNPGKRRIACQKYYNEHKEEINRKNRENYRRNKEEIKEKIKQRKEIRSGSDYLDVYGRIKNSIFSADEKECKTILAILRRPGCGNYAKEDAILTLGARRYRKAFSSILPYLNSPVPFVRNAAIWAFGEQQEVRAIPYLLEVAKNARESLEIIEIVNSLKNMGNQAALHALREVPHKGGGWIRERIEDAVAGFTFRDITKEDNSLAKLRAEYVKELVRTGILVKETYLNAYDIYTEANKMILNKYDLQVRMYDEEETMIPVPLKAQRSLRMKYCLGRTRDPEIIKTLLIIEKIREIGGGKLKHVLILPVFDKFK